ncbi:MAG: CerR family C-terminal domain-containing protein [Lentisphaeria bacterium]|nr:CerR family C-terminal domain-containing protein [Lentisphaeria bacterium]
MGKTGTTTPERVLHAAYGLFAAKGYEGTTTQDICNLAQANIAAVNYHFGGKENLYRAVWEYGDAQARRRQEEGIPAGSPPEERLRRFIELRVQALLGEDETGWFGQLVHREMASPSPLQEELHERFLRPRHQWFRALVREIVGEGVSDQEVRLAGFCIHSPLIHLSEMRNRAVPRPRHPDGPTSDPAALAGTLYTFALAGLRELRARHETNCQARES